ncbi:MULTISPECIES: sec-independent translocase [unclassified Streptomyces]|uniref:sec-independent translocase n=1 Tax=unclassified Streptomyces TaxID=2593676 RepID=UPI002E18CDB6|nr:MULTISPECIES: sec-independent translocase [unclassified Streptomyces]
MLSDVGPMELVTIAVIGILLFGPDRLPEFLQNAARTVRKIREFSDSAQQEIRSELGPEFQDFDVRDLHPKTFVRKHVLNDDGALGRDLADIRDALDPRRELSDAADALQDASSVRRIGEARDATTPEPAVSLSKAGTAPGRTRTDFDPDAT